MQKPLTNNVLPKYSRHISLVKIDTLTQRDVKITFVIGWVLTTTLASSEILVALMCKYIYRPLNDKMISVWQYYQVYRNDIFSKFFKICVSTISICSRKCKLIAYTSSELGGWNSLQLQTQHNYIDSGQITDMFCVYWAHGAEIF